MNVKEYETKRNELVRVLDKVLALELPVRTREPLEWIRQKVFEDQFLIVLVSPFQGGKSTTFDTLCDGMEISPRGAMLKTSATVISAQNTRDPVLAGTAQITWRHDRELILVFSKLVLPHLQRLAPERFESMDMADLLVNTLDLSKDLAMIRRALELEWERYVTSPRTYEGDTLEVLRVATLICRHYNSPFMHNLRQRQSFTVEELAGLVCFPDKWEVRWGANAATEFAAEECPFVFIKRAHCFVRSLNLERTGSVVVDCPGLFASAYDTRVAMEILESADVVWYLLGAKGIGDSELRIIKQVAAAKANSLFFSVNMNQSPRKNIVENIIPNNVSRLNQSGILKAGVTEKDFFTYHALLALTSAQAEKLLAKRLDPHSEAAILHLSKKFGGTATSVQEALDETAFNCLQSIGTHSRQALRDFHLFESDENGIQMARQQSEIDAIVGAVENEAIQKKARSVLVWNGSHKATEAIKQLEKDLEAAENAARENESQMQQKFDDAKRKLTAFQAYCREELQWLEHDSIDMGLAFDYWEKVIQSSIDEVADEAASQIAQYDVRDIARQKQIINDIFAEAVEPKAAAWAAAIKDGSNEKFNELIVSPMNRVIERTHRQWELVIEDAPVLDGLPVPNPIVGENVMDTEFINNVVEKTPGIARTVVVGTGCGVALGAVIGSFIFPGIGTWIGGTIGGALAGILAVEAGQEERREKIRLMVRDGLVTSVARNQREALAKQAARVQAVRERILSAFEDAFSKQQEALQQRQTEARQMFQMEQHKREALAGQHHEFRTVKLAPLREEIEGFELEVEQLLGNGNNGIGKVQ